MINIAAVGCGYWGPNLIRNFNWLGDCRVRMVCDVDRNRLAHIQSLYPHVETTANFEDVVTNPQIDAVIIATPVRFHY